MKLLQSFFLRMAHLFFLVLALAATTNIWGQCEKVNNHSDVFRTVSENYREKLKQRFEFYLQNKCDENIEEIYEMLVSPFRALNKKADFMSDMKAYYSGENRFVSFNPTEVHEFSSKKDNLIIISFWFFEGCISEIIRGKKRSRKIMLEAYLEGSEIFFNDITSRPSPSGETQKCKP